MTYFNEFGQARLGWRIPGAGVTQSTLSTSIFAVWNADTTSTVTTLGTGTFAAWNAEDVISSTQLSTNIFGVWNAEALGASLDTSIYRVYNGDNVNDTSGNAQNGTNVNNVTFTTGKVGNAFTFNGSNYISLPNNSLNLSDSGSNAYSISLWVKFTNITGLAQGFLTNWMQSGSNSWGWMIWYYQNQFYFTRRAGTSTSYDLVTPTIPAMYPNTDYHIAVTRKNGSTKLYINGVVVASDTSTVDTVYTTTHYPLIGARQSYVTPVYEWHINNGSKVDAVNVWNRELTANEVTSLYNSGNGAEYPFSTQTLDSLNDAVGSNHGIRPASTLTNGVLGPAFTTGKIGKAFTFDGINDYISLGNDKFNFAGNFSISGWINLNSVSGNQCIFSNYTFISPNVSNGWVLLMRNNKLYFELYQNNNTYIPIASNTNFNTSTWYHISIVRVASQSTKIYINGVLDNSNSSTYNPTYSSSIPIPSSIGANKYDATTVVQFTNGKIDALNIWNRELTAAEVTALYNSGNAQQYPFSGVTLSGVTSDALGNYNGTNNGVTFTTGKTGTSAFSFNGSSNYIALPQAALNFNKGNSGQSIGDFSVSFWVNLNTGSSDYQTIISNWGDNGYGWQVVVYGGSFILFGSDGSNGSTGRIQHSVGLSKTNAINQWVHVVVTYTNQSQVKSYVNGVLTNTSSTTYQILTNSRNNGVLGTWVTDGAGTKGWYLNGKLDAVTLWTKALTDAEASALYNNGTGYQYSFPSSATGYLSSYNDAVGSNHGTTPASTITNGVPGPTFTAGKIGQAFLFDGINDYVELPNNIMKFSNTDNWSISFWIYANVTGYSVVIGNNDYSGGQGTGWGIRTNTTAGGNPDKFIIQFFTNWINGSGTPSNVLQTDGTASVNTWNHFVITRNSSAQEKIYQNGTLVASQTNPSTKLIYPATSYSCIGANRYQSNIGAYAKAGSKIDAMSVWNKELSASEVTELYNSGNGKQHPY